MADEHDEDRDTDRPLGRLVAPGDGSGVDDEATEIAEEIAPAMRRDQLDAGDPGMGDERLDFVAERDEVVPAEEAAMHLTDPPPMGDGDGYIDD